VKELVVDCKCLSSFTGFCRPCRSFVIVIADCRLSSLLGYRLLIIDVAHRLRTSVVSSTKEIPGGGHQK
jgi:hypothetical protein